MGAVCEPRSPRSAGHAPWGAGQEAVKAVVRWGARRGLVSPLFLYPAIALGLIPLAVVVVTDLDAESQFLFWMLTMVLLFTLKRFESRWVTLLLIVLSVTVSSRYLWWRFNNTLEFQSWSEAFLGTGLFLAEVYAWLVLILGFVQTAWPLERRPAPLPADQSRWPTVDVYIPTYNEPLSVVRNTVLGALNMDYPHDKMRIYILDDGRREEFRRFAEATGCGYITRPDNRHAKAGNLNHALGVTDGELIACFDCDHIPTRAFLQIALGWFDRDPNLALVQTPHHFYSPDPFERNLAGGRSIPNEGQLFYGLVQEGNDFWNAAFFCGSCAVLRRTAIEDIGGFAVETVTEDAHTALKLHRRGYNSAYLRVPMAAGLATERLALHMGQRMRWARGMSQIFRVDNPLLGRGLTLAQRLCYLNAMLHFFFALPRFVFLTAPLAFLLFQQNIIAASAFAILVYAAPHLIHAWVTNSRVQSRYRYSFWGEVYESVLAFYLLKPTLLTLVNPRGGKFNVTEKGGLLPRSYFDGKYVMPQLVLIMFLTFALVVGVLRMLFQDMPMDDIQVLLLNMAWAFFNLIVLLGAIVVALEARQIRSQVRIPLKVPAIARFADGAALPLVSEDISMGGAQFHYPSPDGDMKGQPVRLDLEVEPGVYAPIRARVVMWAGGSLRVAFEADSIAEQRALVRIVFGRADAWLDWDKHEPDRPARSFGRIFTVIGAGLRGISSVRSAAKSEGMPARAASPRPTPAGRVPFWRRIPRLRGGQASAVRSLVLVGLVSAVGIASVATGAGAQVAPPPVPTGQTSASPPPPVAGPRALVRPGTQVVLPEPVERRGAPEALATGEAVVVPGQASVPGQPSVRADEQRIRPGERRFEDRRSAFVPLATAAREELVRMPEAAVGTRRTDVVSLADMGVRTPIRLRGVYDDATLAFSIRRDEVVVEAEVTVDFSYSPALIPDLSHLVVLLNDETVGSIRLDREYADGATVSLPVNPALFQERNRIRFEFVGHYTLGCEDPLHSTLWGSVSNTTSVEMVKERLPLRSDLSLLPLPFFDENDMNPLVLPFVLPRDPSNEVLRAAGIVASYFGREARFRGSSFPVTFGEVPEGNAVVFATGNQRPSGLGIPSVPGATASVATNPYDEDGHLLLVLGASGEDVVAAAQSLALAAPNALSGATARLAPPDLAPRRPLDAPYWIPLDRPVRFGELINEVTDLQGVGLNPGLLTVNFSVPPGIFAWRDAGIPMSVRYRYPGGPWVDYDISRLDVLINNAYLRSLPLEPTTGLRTLRDVLTSDFVQSQGTVSVPPSRVFGRNQLQFFYNIKPIMEGECADRLPDDVRTAIDPESTIDFSGALRFTPLPNLAFFANSGYPFTRMADLSETAVVVPSQIDESDVQAYLGMMGLMAESTGYPVVSHRVVRPGEVDTVAERDLLVIGPVGRQPLLQEWASGTPLQVEEGRIRVRSASVIDRLYTIMDPDVSYRARAREREGADELLVSAGSDLAMLLGFESPARSGRTAVVLTGTESRGMLGMTNAVRSRDLVPLIQGDMVVLKGNRLSSFRVGNVYVAETVPFWQRVRWYFADRPVVLLVFLLLGVVLVSMGLFALLRRVSALRLRRRAPGAG